MRRKVLLLILALLFLNVGCGGAPATESRQQEVETEDTPRPVELPSTPTDYIPPTTTSVALRSTPTDYVPPTVTPYVPPTVPASPPVDTSSQSPIDQKYSSLGGPGGFLGQSETSEESTPDGIGRFQHFQGGSIYWSPSTGAWEVHGLIREKWASLGWETSFLGYPLTDETTTPDGIGRFNHFQGGSIYWTPNTGAWEVHGVIRDRWAQLGWETSCLGYPVSDEEPSSGGWERQSRFEHGIILWSANRGAVETCY